MSSPIYLSKKQVRPSTPIRRRCLVSLPCNSFTSVRLEQALADLIDRVHDSTDSSTQLLLRLYHHKLTRLDDQPEKRFAFQQEVYASLRRLHPSISNDASVDQENQVGFEPKPVVTCRSAQATVRKLHWCLVCISIGCFFIICIIKAKLVILWEVYWLLDEKNEIRKERVRRKEKMLIGCCLLS